MSDFDLDRLGDVWRQQPDPEEMQRLQRTAIAVARRARLAAIVDVCAAIAVAAVVVLLVITNPKMQTVAMGSAAILVLLGSNIRLRRLRKVELMGLTGNTEDMLDQSIARIETTLRHHKFTFYGIPAVLLGTFVFAAMAGPERRAMLGSLGEILWFRAILLGASVAALVGLALYLVIFIGRGRRELNRLNAMREAYRQEQESSAA
jgi:uncharacterized membrane protein